MFLGILLRLFQLLLSKLPAKGGAAKGGDDAAGADADATVGFAGNGETADAGSENALKKEVEALTDDINAMLDKLKSVDEQSRG